MQEKPPLILRGPNGRVSNLLREPDQVRTSYVMMVLDLRPAHPSEETLRIIRASVVERVGFLMVDPFHDEAAMQ
jgi:hypothetical protein